MTGSACGVCSSRFEQNTPSTLAVPSGSAAGVGEQRALGRAAGERHLGGVVVDGDHGRAAVAERARVVPGAAAEVDDRLAGERAVAAVEVSGGLGREVAVERLRVGLLGAEQAPERAGAREAPRAQRRVVHGAGAGGPEVTSAEPSGRADAGSAPAAGGRRSPRAAASVRQSTRPSAVSAASASQWPAIRSVA